MRGRTDRNEARNADENRKTDQNRNAERNKDKEKNAEGNRESRNKRNGLLPVSFIKTGKEIVGSVLFWCAAVSIAVSACHAAGDVITAIGSRGLSEEQAGQKPETVPAGNQRVQKTVLTKDQDEKGAVSTENQGKEMPAGSKQAKTVALTFDDGPHPVYTKKLLDGLLERQVKATFFVIGENIPGNEKLIARMEEEGHLIGNHTYNHVKICDMKKEDACSQVEKTSALVKEITGHDTEFVRPPFGAWNPDLECSFVMIPVLWDVDPLDWTTSNTPLVVQRVVEDAGDQDIILLHDYYESSVNAALQIVDILKQEGFEFVTVDKLILP